MTPLSPPVSMETGNRRCISEFPITLEAAGARSAASSGLLFFSDRLESHISTVCSVSILQQPSSHLRSEVPSITTHRSSLPLSSQGTSDIQRATLNKLRQLIPLWKWHEIIKECRDPKAVYNKLHDMAARRQIKGVRLEVRKQEWIAAWTDQERRERRKYFSIRQQGDEYAWYMAVKTRADALNDGARVRWGMGSKNSSQPLNRTLEL